MTKNKWKSFNELYSETLIVVPCYNASETIEHTLGDILATGFYNVIVSDDYSIERAKEYYKNKEDFENSVNLF